MSRESDSSSSGAQGGHGGAAYPSGNPPYGSRQYPTPEGPPGGADDGEAGEPAKPEEPKTETTLTTRIKINIPGSRPIPPVVMRTPMSETGDRDAAPDGDDEPVARSAGPDASPTAEPDPDPDPERDKDAEGKASDWFSPRRAKQSGAGGPLRPSEYATPDSTTQFPTSSAGTGTHTDLPYFSDQPATGTPEGPGGPVYGTGTPNGSGTTPLYEGSGLSGYDPTGTPGYDSSATPGYDPSAGPGYTDTPADGFPAFGTGGGDGFPGAGYGTGGPAAGGGPGGFGTDTPSDGFPGSGGGPDGPTTGPATGDMGGFEPQPPTPPQGSPLSGSLGATTAAGPPGALGSLGANPPVGFGNDAAPPLDQDVDMFRDPGAAGPGAEHVSGDTLVSGIPVVPSGGDGPGPAFITPGGPGPAAGADTAGPVFGTGQDESGGGPGFTAPTPAPSSGGSGKKAAKAKKAGRPKAVMLGVALVAVIGVAYAAGLVMNHADVPNGTTVLGVDIGGTSKQAAVDKLDTALGDRTHAPLKVTVDGEQHQLKPSVAGLALDTEATVRDIAGRDYNPVTVIGSLFGGTHKAEPTVTVDEEKLRDALQRLAGDSGTAREGTITFTSGKAVAVYGKAGKGLDIDQAVSAVDQAFRERAATGEDRPITLPVTTKKPKISDAEVDKMMKSFAEPAMSGIIHVQTDAAHDIPLGPDRSLPKILSMRVVSGNKLAVHYDLDVLKGLYGSTFDGVMITRGNGSKTPVTPNDVAVAMGKALTGKTAADRIGVIETDAN